MLVAQDVLELLVDHSPHPFPYGLSILLVEPHSEHGIFAYHQSGAGKLEVPVPLGRKVAAHGKGKASADDCGRVDEQEAVRKAEEETGGDDEN